MADIPLKLYKKENYVQVAPGFNTPAGSTPITNYSEVLKTAKQRYNELSSMGTLADTSLLGRLNTGTATAEDVHKIYTTGGASMSSQESQQLLSALQSLQSNNVMPSSGYSNVNGVMTSNASIAEKQAHEAALTAGTEVNIGTAEAPLYVPTGSPAATNPLGGINVAQPTTTPTPTPTTTPTATRQEVVGFPKSSDEYEQWIAQGRTFENGKWYEGSTAAISPTDSFINDESLLSSPGYRAYIAAGNDGTPNWGGVSAFKKSSYYNGPSNNAVAPTDSFINDESLLSSPGYRAYIAAGNDGTPNWGGVSAFKKSSYYNGPSNNAVAPTDRVAGQTLAGNPQAQAVLDEMRKRIDNGTFTQEEIDKLPTAVKIALVEPAVDEMRKRYDTGTITADEIPQNIKELMLGPALTELQDRINAGTINKDNLAENIKELLVNNGDVTGDTTTKVTQDTGGIRDKEKEAKEAAAKAENDKAVASAQEIVNQQAELAKLQTQAEIDKYREQLGAIKKPEEVNFTSTYETLRSQYGVSGIEQSVNSLNSQITALQDSLTAGLYDEEGKLRPMELISARQQEMTRQVQEKLATLNRSKENLQAELNTKNTLISNIMSLKQTDYANAQQEYEKEYSKQMDMINLTRDVEEEAEDDAKALTDAAQANLNTVVNMTEGKSWDELDATLKGKIAELELKAGLPSGITQTFLNEKPDAEILTTTTGYDANGDQVVSFVYKNPDGTVGTIKTVKTGAVAQADTQVVGSAETGYQLINTKTGETIKNISGGTGGGNDKEIEKFRSDVADYIEKLDTGEIKWGAAWDALHAKYPNASNETIDSMLGGGYDTASKKWWGRAAE